ncbi:MAG: ribokinase [Bryobacteraceae bacterium]
MTPAIVVVGSLNMDFVVRVAHLPAPGETILGTQFQTIPGGKGANQAYAAARLGANVRMIGRVGYDMFGDQLKASLAAAGADVSGVHATRNAPTGVALIWVDAEGQNSIVVASGANGVLQALDAHAMRPAFSDARFALFQLETPIDAVSAAMRVARECGAVTILDPAPAQALSREILAHVDILTPNETEACILLGREVSAITPEDAPAIARELLALGPRAVILKLGERGCYYASDGQAVYSAACKVTPVDSTAAGDTFNAAFAVACSLNRELPDALAYANAAAAVSVTRAGAQSSAPTHEDVLALLR